MRHKNFPVILFLFAALTAVDICRAQPKPTQTNDTNLPGPANWSAEQDHRNMMEQLGIKTLRPGAEGFNRQAPNYQNTDEAKANPYPNLPDPLTLKNGTRVTTPEMWWKQRRPEIVGDFDREVYGRVPKNVPEVTWEVTGIIRTNNGAVPVITKQLVGRVDNSSYPLISVNIQLTLTTPAQAAGPVPVMMEYGFGNFGGFGRDRFGGQIVLAGRTDFEVSAHLAADPIGNNWFYPMAGVTPSLFPPAIRPIMAPA